MKGRQKLEDLLEVAPAKEALKLLGKHCKNEWGVQLTRSRLIANLQEDDLPPVFVSQLAEALGDTTATKKKREPK